MKKVFLCLALALLTMPFVACGDDDDDLAVVENLSQVVGTWVCTASKDVWNTERSSGNADGLMVGETLTIKQDGTYESSSNNFGRKGTWSVQGGKFSAQSSSGKIMSGSISVSEKTLRINGSTIDGYQFDYTFARK